MKRKLISKNQPAPRPIPPKPNRVGGVDPIETVRIILFVVLSIAFSVLAAYILVTP